MSDSSALIEISKAQRALETAHDIHEILELRDRAAAYQVLANAKGFKEAAQEAKIFQLKAERKAGDWLSENVSAGNPQFYQDGRNGTLPEGITWNESSRWQLEAGVPEPIFNDWIDDCLTTDKEISAAGLQRRAREIQRGKKLQEIQPIDGKFRVIYADPPWRYNDAGVINGSDSYGRAERHYPTMSMTEIQDLPIVDIVEDNAVLFLWTTSPFLEDVFKVIKAWGFEYKTSFVWDKVKHNFGHYNSVRHEMLLVCTRGLCTPDNVKLYDSVQSIERSDQHSEKPKEFREIIDDIYPYGARIELFARKQVDGWESWGNEAG